MDTSIQLQQINNAIAAIETGAQEYQIGSRRITKADISTLYKERQRLEQKQSMETNSCVYVATFDRR